MDRQTAIARMKAHEADFRAMGAASLSLFGSMAPNEVPLLRAAAESALED